MDTFFQNLTQYLNEYSPLAYLIAFLGGLATSFTPCVYPILPILVGVIGATSGRSRLQGFLLSSAFALGMALTYSTLGLFAALTGKIFGQLTVNPAAYLAVGNLCLIFALSMLGLFELRLPGKWGHPGSPGDKKGLWTVFFMGMSSGLVAAPCTVPVLGTLLTFVAETRNAVFGFSLLFTFALGLGALLVGAGTFEGFLVSLPKSGPWLARVKQAFGVLLILAAEYFILQAGRMM